MAQDFYNIVVACAGAAIGWLLKVLWDSVRSLQQDMKEIEKELHTGYVSKEDYRQHILEIRDYLNRIFEKLDGKADK